MAQDWLADVKKYVANANEAAVAGIVRYCGIALRSRDASLVSFSDSAETDRVRERFLKKKLALTDPDATLDAAIAEVGERMKGDRTKNRVTVYYLLAEKFGKLGLFDKGGTDTEVEEAAADTPPDDAPSGAAAAAGAAGLAALGGTMATGTATAATTTPAGGTGAGTTAASGFTDTGGGGATDGHEPHGFADVPGDAGGSILGKWWLWLLVLLALVALFLLLRSCHQQPVGVVDNSMTTTTETTTTTTTTDNMVGTAGTDGNAAAPVAATTPPEGAGVVSEMRGDHPALVVYFATGKAGLAPDFAAKAADLKAYVAAHPDAKLAVSGYNDPTGNAAVNAELSKNRAKAVAAALKAEGIAESAISLEKPADTTIISTDKAAARRVEVTIK